MPDPAVSPEPFTATRLLPFGESIFTPITALSIEHGAINLGQGFPDFDGPDFVKQAALEAMHRGLNQYAPMSGVPPLREGVADWFARASGIQVDPARCVTVTSGCTQAIAASVLGLVNPGDEVILIEPYYDSYPACVAMAGATARFVALHPPEFRFDDEELRRAFGPRTRAIIVNTPHNPTGRVFDREELGLIAELCDEHDVIAITDEVYERLVFEGRHVPLAAIDGMFERTVTMSSLGKTFSLTGWKIGWAVAPPALTAGIRAAHQFLTYSTAAPLQYGAAAALRGPETYFVEFLEGYRRRRDLLIDGLKEVGFKVQPPQGTYFVLADHTPFGFSDDMSFARHMIEHVGVGVIPPSAFYHDPADGRALIRFAFCKGEQTLKDAVQRMRERLG